MLPSTLVVLLVGTTSCMGDRAVPADEPVDFPDVWLLGPRLPEPTANNGVAAVERDGVITVLSVLGIDSTKVWTGVTNRAFRWEVGQYDGWYTIESIPGPGRLAPTVEVVGGRFYVFGGYTVAEDGSEQSWPTVDVYDPVARDWSRAPAIPTPVDDAVSGVLADSLIYLVSGWHDGTNVADVQILDVASRTWSVGTPITGAPVFGHSGSITGSSIVYVGGARIVDASPRFVADTAAWLGRIDPADHTSIAWDPLPTPPGLPLYRAAAGSSEGVVLIVGGSSNPYNYTGIGYDSRPSEPEHQVVAYDPDRGWLRLPPPPVATMDHRNVGVAGGWIFVVGGMEPGQRVSDRVWYARIERLLDEALPVG